jgi:Protein  of unknown function (DUF3018)
MSVAHWWAGVVPEFGFENAHHHHPVMSPELDRTRRPQRSRRTTESLIGSAWLNDDARNVPNRVRSRARNRARMRQQGLWLLQIWVPDTTAPEFAAEALRQGQIVGANYAPDAPDAELLDFWERIADEVRRDVWR